MEGGSILVSFPWAYVACLFFMLFVDQLCIPGAEDIRDTKKVEP